MSKISSSVSSENQNNISYRSMSNNLSPSSPEFLNTLNEMRNSNKNIISKNKQRLIFLPTIILVITAPILMMLFYLRYAYNDQIKEKHSFIMITILYFYVIFLYLLSAFKKATVSDVAKYFDPSNCICNYNPNKPGTEIKSISPYDWTYCQFCNKPKYKRSSHCRICKECILLRDHHCPWIANCVGYGNVQYFINFLVWATIGIWYYFYLSIRFINSYTKDKINERVFFYNYKKIVLIVNCCVSIIIFFFSMNVLNALIHSLLNAYNGSSYNERRKMIILERYIPFYKQNNTNFKWNMYNLGYLENLYYMIGPTLLHLFFPLPKNLHFNLNEDIPIFQGCAIPDKISLVKKLAKINPAYRGIMSNKENEPDYFIELSHKYYDNIKIIN